MTTRYHIGISDFRHGIEAYAKKLDFHEVAISIDPKSTLEAPRTLPTLATLRKWRRQAPPHFEFAVVAPPEVSQLKERPGFDVAVLATNAAVNALQARVLLLRTPREVTPASVWRTRMASLLERLPRDVTRVVWEPSGLWEVGDAALAAKRWGIVLCVDASRDPVPPGDAAYVRLRALGETRSFGESALERVVEAIGSRQEAYVMIDTQAARREASLLKKLARGRVSRSFLGDDEEG